MAALRSKDLLWFPLTLLFFTAVFVLSIPGWDLPMSGDFGVYVRGSNLRLPELLSVTSLFPLYTLLIKIIALFTKSVTELFYAHSYFFLGAAVCTGYALARLYASAFTAALVSLIIMPALFLLREMPQYAVQFILYAAVLLLVPRAGHRRFPWLILLIGAGPFLRLDFLVPSFLLAAYVVWMSLQSRELPRRTRILAATAAPLIAVAALVIVCPDFVERGRLTLAQHVALAEVWSRGLDASWMVHSGPLNKEIFGTELPGLIEAFRLRPVYMLLHVLRNVPLTFAQFGLFLSHAQAGFDSTMLHQVLTGAFFGYAVVRLLIHARGLSLTQTPWQERLPWIVPVLIVLVHLASILLLFPRTEFMAGLLPAAVVAAASALELDEDGTERRHRRLYFIGAGLAVLSILTYAWILPARDTHPMRTLLQKIEHSLPANDDSPVVIAANIDPHLLCVPFENAGKTCSETDVIGFEINVLSRDPHADPWQFYEERNVDLIFLAGHVGSLPAGYKHRDGVRYHNVPLGMIADPGPADLDFAKLGPDVFLARDEERLKDLRPIAAALERYKAKSGSYPQTQNQWFARRSCMGMSTDDWIPGLVPEFLDALPRDPRRNDACEQQYHYRSDGQNYELISLLPEALSLRYAEPELYHATLPALMVDSFEHR